RVLSPRIEPPVRAEVGSTASTATLWLSSIRYMPSASMVVDLPTPGEPVMPTRIALPVPGNSACTRSRAAAGAELLGEGFDVGDLGRSHSLVYTGRVIGARASAPAVPRRFNSPPQATGRLLVLGVALRTCAAKDALTLGRQIGLQRLPRDESDVLAF